MKFGRFEIGGRKRLGAFENQWIIDLNAAYQMLLLEKGTLDASVMANSEIPLDLRAFIKKNETFRVVTTATPPAGPFSPGM